MNLEMETRVQKYKDYRASLIKDDTQFYSGKPRTETKTLPISEVINTVEKPVEAKTFKGYKFKRTLIYASIILVIALVVAGIIVLGVFAFKE